MGRIDRWVGSYLVGWFCLLLLKIIGLGHVLDLGHLISGLICCIGLWPLPFSFIYLPVFIIRATAAYAMRLMLLYSVALPAFCHLPRTIVFTYLLPFYSTCWFTCRDNTVLPSFPLHYLRWFVGLFTVTPLRGLYIPTYFTLLDLTYRWFTRFTRWSCSFCAYRTTTGLFHFFYGACARIIACYATHHHHCAAHSAYRP